MDASTRSPGQGPIAPFEAQFRSLFDLAGDGVVVVDPHGRFLDVNPAMCRMLGRSRDELLSAGPAHANGDFPRVEKIGGGTQVPLQWTFRRGDESTLDAVVLASKLPDGNLLALVREVSHGGAPHGHPAHAAMAEEHGRLLAAQRVAKIGDWETDLATMEVTWSEETYRIHDADPGRFRPTHAAFLELVHPEDRDRVAKAFSASLDSSEPGVIEHRLLLGGGSVKYVEERWTTKSDADGRAVRAVGTCQDITSRKLAEMEVRESRDRLRLATQAAQIAIWDWDIRADALTLDARMHELYATSAADFGEGIEAWRRRLHPDDRDRVEADIQAALAGTDEFDTEFRVPWPGGEVRHLRAKAVVQRDEGGAPTRAIGINYDVTERKRAEMRIGYLSRVYAMLSGINTLIVRVRSREELFEGACRIAVEEGGFRMAMVAAVEPDTGVVAPVAAAGMDARYEAAVRQAMGSPEQAPKSMIARAIAGREPIISNDARSDPQLLLSRLTVDAGVQSIVVLPLLVGGEAVAVLVLYGSEKDLFHAEEMKLLNELSGDIAFAIDHIVKRERLEYLAYYDELTGLPNRARFLERVSQCIRDNAGSGRKFAVFLFDLERFRNINDSLGRAAGDALLRQVADWLRRNAGDPGLLAHLSADQFAFVLPEVKPDGNLAGLLEKPMERFQQHPFLLEGNAFRIAPKAGVSVFPDDGDSADRLVRNAEAALKQAKVSGNRYMFYQATMNESVAVRLSLENQLREALDKGEFELHYQPKVSLATGEMTGAEALIRWNRPQVGLVPPGQFIPVLEETGLIHQAGRWAMQRAISDYLRWLRAGLPVQPIAVNVSSLQLRSRAFVAEVEQLIRVDPAAAGGLQLEITESMIMEDVDHGIAALKAIRDMGVSVALDDFGTGYASLSYLAKLPVNLLKIDRSFINEMTLTPEGLSLVSTMIGLAHTLGLKVVAEGVETEEQARLLRLLRCDEMQGFLYSRPVPGDRFESRFLARSPGG